MSMPFCGLPWRGKFETLNSLARLNLVIRFYGQLKSLH